MSHLQGILVLGLCWTIHYYYRHRSQAPLPPGPKRLPLVGSALSIPPLFMWKYFDAMGKKLGSNILYFEAFGQPIVVLNDLKVVQDLLDKRSAIYSSRPHLTMALDLVDMNHVFGFNTYGDVWRERRKAFTQYFSPRNTSTVGERVEEFVRKSFLPKLLQSPEDYRSHLHECFGGFSMSITYGLPIRPTGDPWVRMVDDSFKITIDLVQPGKYLVDIIPWLKYVPSWIPGAKFKRDAKEWKTLMKESMTKPFDAAAQAMLDGTARPSFVTTSLAQYDENSSDYADRARVIKETASMIYIAGAQTTVACNLTFILAMLKFPEVQRRAQEEIDSVIGHDRLPCFSDVEQLPYLSAVMKEALRWHVIGPIGIPHSSDEDDTYDGYLIPKGSMVIGNVYTIFRDEKTFPNPQEFIPERFLCDGKLILDGVDPEAVALFGFGRRICPGSHVGLLGYHMTAMCLLSLFDISPQIDDYGRSIDVPLRFTGHTADSLPEPFPCKITPRAGRNTENLLQEFMGVETI